jgi:hypothetical protein
MHVVESIDATSFNESIESDEHAAPTQVTDNEQEQANVQEDPVKQLVLIDDTLASEIIQITSSLKAKDMKSTKWVNSSTTTLIELVSSLDNLKSLRHTDLNVIYSCLENKLDRQGWGRLRSLITITILITGQRKLLITITITII